MMELRVVKVRYMVEHEVMVMATSREDAQRRAQDSANWMGRSEPVITGLIIQVPIWQKGLDGYKFNMNGSVPGRPAEAKEADARHETITVSLDEMDELIDGFYAPNLTEKGVEVAEKVAAQMESIRG